MNEARLSREWQGRARKGRKGVQRLRPVSESLAMTAEDLARFCLNPSRREPDAPQGDCECRLVRRRAFAG